MKEWVPLFQTIAWIGLIVLGAKKFSAQFENLFEAVCVRIRSGSSFKAGPVELGEDLGALEKVNPSESIEGPKENDWAKERDGIYQSNNGIFIAHVIGPSKKKDSSTISLFILYDINRTSFLTLSMQNFSLAPIGETKYLGKPRKMG